MNWNKKNIASCLAALLLTVSAIFQIPVCAQEDTGAGGSASASPIATNSIPGWPQGADITSTAAVIMEDSTNTVIYNKNMDTPLLPAGTVKIMTCLLALENCSLTDEVTMTATGVSGVTDGGASISSQIGEIFTVEQCLYAIMVASANDIALQIAEHVGGSVEQFVTMMNTRAQELGCTNTVFVNPTGLPGDGQQTTAHDMALIMQAAMKNETFRAISSATTYVIPQTNLSGGDRALSSSFPMTNSTAETYYSGCLGGKESFTTASGSTLVCAAYRNNMTLVCVILEGVSGQTDDEAIALLDYAFGNFDILSLGDEDFRIVSGGDVLAPIGTEADALTYEDVEENGVITRTYYFGGTRVGTSVVEKTPVIDDTAQKNSDAHMQESKNFSDSKSVLPYILIGVIGAGLLVFLILRIRKIVRA